MKKESKNDMKPFIILILMCILIGCGSPKNLQYENTKAYQSGIPAVDAVVAEFQKQHSFENTQIWLYNIRNLETFTPNGQLAPSSAFEYDFYAHSSTILIERFYFLELAEHSAYSVNFDRTLPQEYTFQVIEQDSDGTIKRIVYGELVGEEYVIIDAY